MKSSFALMKMCIAHENDQMIILSDLLHSSSTQNSDNSTMHLYTIRMMFAKYIKCDDVVNKANLLCTCTSIRFADLNERNREKDHHQNDLM